MNTATITGPGIDEQPRVGAPAWDDELRNLDHLLEKTRLHLNEQVKRYEERNAIDDWKQPREGQEPGQ